MEGWWLFALVIIALAAVVTKVLHSYTDLKRVGLPSFMVVWVGWFLNFSILLMVPLDVATLLHNNCVDKHDGNLDYCGGGPWVVMPVPVQQILWKILYWTIYVMCWTLFPITQSFSMAGEFFFFEKLRTAIKENLKFWALMGTIGLFFLIAIIISFVKSGREFGFYELIAIGVGSSNAWGMFLLMGFLGYSLVEVPKFFWNHANHAKTLNYYNFLAVSYKENCQKTKQDLDGLLKQVKKYDQRIQPTDPFRPMIDKIIAKCPIEYKDVIYGEGDDSLTYKNLVDLHWKLKKYGHEARGARSLYINLLNRAYRLEDITKSYNNAERVIRWSFKPKRTYKLAPVVDKLEWVYHKYIHSLLYKLFAILCACMGAMVVWSEMFFNINRRYPQVNLSIFSLIINSRDNFSFQTVWIFVFVPMAFIAGCAYWTLFRLKLFNIYRLIPHHNSSIASLLFCTMYISRLTAIMAYNYVFMISINTEIEHGLHYQETAYYSVFRPLRRVPTQVGEGFNTYFPIVLVVLCLATMFDLYSKFITTFCSGRWRRYIYDEELSESIINQGREIIEYERDRKEKGMSLSVDEVDKIRGIGRFLKSSKGADGNSKGMFSSFTSMFSKSPSSNNLELEEKDADADADDVSLTRGSTSKPNSKGFFRLN